MIRSLIIVACVFVGFFSGLAVPREAPTCFFVGPPGPGHGVSIEERSR